MSFLPWATWSSLCLFVVAHCHGEFRCFNFGDRAGWKWNMLLHFLFGRLPVSFASVSQLNATNLVDVDQKAVSHWVYRRFLCSGCGNGLFEMPVSHLDELSISVMDKKALNEDLDKSFSTTDSGTFILFAYFICTLYLIWWATNFTLCGVKRYQWNLHISNRKVVVIINQSFNQWTSMAPLS